MKKLTVFMTFLFLISVTFAYGAPVDGTDNKTQHDEDDHRKENDSKPGFLSELVDSVTPDFLGDLFKKLPVPDFVKGLFGSS